MIKINVDPQHSGQPFGCSVLIAILCITSVFVVGCQQAPESPAAPSSPQCSTVGPNSGIMICVDGNGNTFYINVPTPTPTPTPSVPKCTKEAEHLYEVNVVQAAQAIPPNQSMEAHIASLATALEKAGFKTKAFVANSTDSLSRDELAVKAGDGLSETYDAWQGDFVTGSPHVLYVETCKPARF